jgi:2-keto-4-pentenoate hydratase/2-oxohepta-3-ene-1,7-dioic acid hydratase in catechol pathway
MITLPVIGEKKAYTVRPTKIIALGLNYRDHIAESESVDVKGFTTDVPEEPVLFPKTPNVLIGPDEPIILPSFLDAYHFENPRIDYEGELALLIGKQCKDVAPEDAFNVIFGFTCMNDVSQRNIQKGDKSGWFRGKSLDTFGPIGPAVMPAGGWDPQNAEIITRLNGTEVQHSNTSFMIFGIRDIIAFVSKNFTLEEGDIILTGTPAGVGPIADGDTVEVKIDGIGTLRNQVRKEPR